MQSHLLVNLSSSAWDQHGGPIPDVIGINKLVRVVRSNSNAYYANPHYFSWIFHWSKPQDVYGIT